MAQAIIVRVSQGAAKGGYPQVTDWEATQDGRTRMLARRVGATPACEPGADDAGARFFEVPIRQQIETEPESRREWLLDRMAFIARKTRRTELFKLWQDRSHAMEIFSPEFLHRKVDYIHNNPVKNGLVDLSEHYRFISAWDYYTNQKGLVEMELN